MSSKTHMHQFKTRLGCHVLLEMDEEHNHGEVNVETSKPSTEDDIVLNEPRSVGMKPAPLF